MYMLHFGRWIDFASGFDNRDPYSVVMLTLEGAVKETYGLGQNKENIKR